MPRFSHVKEPYVVFYRSKNICAPPQDAKLTDPTYISLFSVAIKICFPIILRSHYIVHVRWVTHLISPFILTKIYEICHWEKDLKVIRSYSLENICMYNVHLCIDMHGIRTSNSKAIILHLYTVLDTVLKVKKVLPYLKVHVYKKCNICLRICYAKLMSEIKLWL